MNQATPLIKLRHLLSESRFGVAIISIIIVLRLLGAFQFLELLTLDDFQQVHLRESPDSRVALVGIDESYFSKGDSASLEYSDLTALLNKILSGNPAVVGVDLVEDDLNGIGKDLLLNLFTEDERLIAVEKIWTPTIAPIEGLSDKVLEERTGFNDISLDSDDHVRRMFLGWTPTGRPFVKSFALMLAEKYLKSIRGTEIENGIRDPYAMRFGNVEIPRLSPFSGGYRNESSIYGIQTLVNFRTGFNLLRQRKRPFEIILASELIQNELDKESINEKIVIIGTLSPSNVSTFSSVIPSSLTYNEKLATGLELQAHAVSQITSAVIDQRPLIRPLYLPLEYALIVAFGFIGIRIKRRHKSTLRSLLYLSAVSLLFTSISYLSFCLVGLWLPIVPVLLALAINGLTYIAVAQSDQRWQALAQQRNRALAAVKLERQKTVEHAFDTIHNGPLQTLANLLRLVKDDQIDRNNVGIELRKLNQEIREIGESLRKEAISDEQLYIKVGQSKLDLTTPLHELFYEIYRETLQRPFPGFETLKIQARSLEPVTPEKMTVECKRKLCRFFEETLCNVGRHAIGATKLTVTGQTVGRFYCLTVIDNGSGLKTLKPRLARKGQGTKIACELETSLKGKFTRKRHYPKGVFCELKWLLI